MSFTPVVLIPHINTFFFFKEEKVKHWIAVSTLKLKCVNFSNEKNKHERLRGGTMKLRSTVGAKNINVGHLASGELVYKWNTLFSLLSLCVWQLKCRRHHSASISHEPKECLAYHPFTPSSSFFFSFLSSSSSHMTSALLSRTLLRCLVLALKAAELKRCCWRKRLEDECHNVFLLEL